MNKIITTSLFLFFVFQFQIYGQTVIQQINLPVIGDLWSNQQIMDTSIQPGPAGMNQTWNFSNYIVNPTVLSEAFTPPTGSGNDALFPSSNLKVNSYFGGFDYYHRTASDLQYLGSKSNSNEIIISNTQRFLSVPFSYGDSISNQPVTGTSLGYQLTGTISVKADGTGDLTLFTGSFPNTLRVTTDINLVQGAGTGLDTYIHIERYTWYSSLYRAPVFQISVFDVSGPLGNAHQKYTTVSTLTTDVKILKNNIFNLSVHPNPARTQVDVSLSLAGNSEVTIKVMDLTGRIWKEVVRDFPKGNKNFRIDVSTLPKGIYIVSAITSGGNLRQRLIVE